MGTRTVGLGDRYSSIIWVGAVEMWANEKWEEIRNRRFVSTRLGV